MATASLYARSESLTDSPEAFHLGEDGATVGNEDLRGVWFSRKSHLTRGSSLASRRSAVANPTWSEQLAGATGMERSVKDETMGLQPFDEDDSHGGGGREHP